jgi:hypothetical protein
MLPPVLLQGCLQQQPAARPKRHNNERVSNMANSRRAAGTTVPRSQANKPPLLCLLEEEKKCCSSNEPSLRRACLYSKGAGLEKPKQSRGGPLGLCAATHLPIYWLDQPPG